MTPIEHLYHVMKENNIYFEVRACDAALLFQFYKMYHGKMLQVARVISLIELLGFVSQPEMVSHHINDVLEEYGAIMSGKSK